MNFKKEIHCTVVVKRRYRNKMTDMNERCEI
jgi:hypothetical protein